MAQTRARSKQAIQQRYDDILEQTSQLFLEQEYEDITLASVAKDLNISRPSLYNYFSSKEELFLALLKKSYLNCENRLRKQVPVKQSTQAFCEQLIHTFFEDALFIKLLSLHSAVLESKCPYETMVQFKKDTLSFFHTQFEIIRQQFPDSSEESCWIFLQRFTTISQTFYQYSHIPPEQVQIMAELKTFGNTPLLSAESYFSHILSSLAEDMKTS